MHQRDILQVLASMELDERIQVIGAALHQTLDAYRTNLLDFAIKHQATGEVAFVVATTDDRIGAVLKEYADSVTCEESGSSEGNAGTRALGRILAKRGGRS